MKACADKVGTMAGFSRHRNIGEPPCAACAEAKRQYAHDWRLAKKAKPLPNNQHGSVAGYQYGCRCGPCATAGRAYARARWAGQLVPTRSPKAERPPAEHGTSAGYKSGCRCDACREHHNAQARRARARRAQPRRARVWRQLTATEVRRLGRLRSRPALAARMAELYADGVGPTTLARACGTSVSVARKLIHEGQTLRGQ